jgi:magnesium chelatase family protein
LTSAVIHVEVPPLKYKELSSGDSTMESGRIREKVTTCRDLQHDRFGHGTAASNARMSPKQLTEHCSLEEDARDLMKQAVDEFGMSARAYSRVLKVSRTIADLDGGERISVEHVAEAIQYRMPHADVWE